MTRHTLHVTVADPGDLPAVIAAIEALGVPVSCPAHDARQRRRSRDEYLLPAVSSSASAHPGVGACSSKRKSVDSRPSCGRDSAITRRRPRDARR